MKAGSYIQCPIVIDVVVDDNLNHLDHDPIAVIHQQFYENYRPVFLGKVQACKSPASGQGLPSHARIS